VKTHHMKGYNAPRLLDRQIRAALAEPIRSDTLSKLAPKRKEAVVLFDDVTRPTQCSRIVPHVLSELAKGGISDDHIRFVAALGAHAANNRIDFVNKLGEETVDRYPIYNHNPDQRRGNGLRSEDWNRLHYPAFNGRLQWRRKDHAPWSRVN
jgi:nickel-dependent lactate racemase